MLVNCRTRASYNFNHQVQCLFINLLQIRTTSTNSTAKSLTASCTLIKTRLTKCFQCFDTVGWASGL